MKTGSLTIINLRGAGTFEFFRFPAEIGTTDTTNWEAVDTAGGLKPLFYANREPQEITISDAVIDRTDTNDSIEPQIEQLRQLMMASGPEGAPPTLQVMTMGFSQRAVLKELQVTRNFFTAAGVAIRAQISLTFAEVAQ